MSFITGIGICQNCGDTQGPWGLFKGRYLCDSCIARENEYEKTDNQGEEYKEPGRGRLDFKEDESTVEAGTDCDS